MKREETIEGTPARLDCLRRGECAAVPLGQPQDLLAASEGYRVLAASFRIIRDPAERASVVNTIVETTGVPATVAERTLALYFEPERKVLPRRAEIDLDGLAQVIAFMGEAGQLEAPLPAPERFVDLQYLREAGVR